MTAITEQSQQNLQPNWPIPNGAQILVVDDTPANLEVITETLNTVGYKISTAISGERALKRLQFYKPDLILLDIRMPGIDGLETCRQIKTNSDTAAIPIIFITALSDTEHITQGFTLGAVDYISKPFRESELLARVKTHLQIQQMNRILEHRVAERTRELESTLDQLRASQIALQRLNQELAQANQQLEDYSQTLEQKVTTRTTQLKVAQERMLSQDKLAALGTLTAGVAHELRNPLNFVQNYAEGSVELSQELLDLLQPTQTSLGNNISDEAQALIADLMENATIICHHSQRAAQVIESMMQHTYVGQGNTALQEIQLHELIELAIKLAYHSMRSHDHSFHLSIRKQLAPNIESITALPGNLMRALINLIDNACDAMRAKQLHQAPSQYTPTLVISTQELQEHVQIAIRDNGCGIEPDIQPKVLDPFFTTKAPGEGTGLGLSLTYDIIVKQHQGTLTVESLPGEYTEFIVSLPRKAPVLDLERG
ncbi:MAG: response regulator [Cyanobacteria bacterium P01_C01_bin.118]